MSSCLLIDSTSGKAVVCGDEDRDGDPDGGADSDEEAVSDDVTSSCAGSLVMIYSSCAEFPGGESQYTPNSPVSPVAAAQNTGFPLRTITLTNSLLDAPEISESDIANAVVLISGFHPCVCPAVSSCKVFLMVKLVETSSAVIELSAILELVTEFAANLEPVTEFAAMSFVPMSSIEKEDDDVGPSIVPPAVSLVVIPTLKLPAVSELIILPISNLIFVPAETLTGS